MHHHKFSNRDFERRHVRIKHANPLVELARLILNKKSLLIGALLLIVTIVSAAIWLIGIILPYIGQGLGQLIAIIDERGIKGILEWLLPDIERIWEGSKK